MAEKKRVNSFDVMKAMSENKDDIRLAPLSNIIAVDKKGDRHTFTIGVDAQMFADWLDSKKKFVGGLILADNDRFVATRKMLEDEEASRN